jgi:L-aspartate oxidase
MMGGVKTDICGRTSIPGLYAAGEVATNGVHGANRLVSNSLLEGLVFGSRSGGAMKKDAPASGKKHGALPGVPAPQPGEPHDGASPHAKSKHAASAQLQQMRELLWSHVGILRNGKELASAIATLQSIETRHTDKPNRFEHELRNLHTLACLITRCALAREESRGSHYRSDFPYRDDDAFQKHSQVTKDRDVIFVGSPQNLAMHHS